MNALDKPLVRASPLLGVLAVGNIIFYGALVGAGWAIYRIIHTIFL